MSKRTRIPENFEVSPRIIDLAKVNGWPDPRKERDAFVDYHLAKGSLMLDWDAAFRTWLRNSVRFAKERKEFVPAPKEPVKQVQEPVVTEQEKAENRRKVGPLLHDLIKQMDVRKAHENKA